MQSHSFALRLLALTISTFILVGCASPTAILPTAVPTIDLQPTLNAVKTQAVQTALVNLTQTAPTATPVTPTNTPLPTATSTPAFTATPVPPTKAPTATLAPWTLTPTVGAYSCSVTSVTPKSTDKVTASSNFDTTWVIKNNGTQTWLGSETDIKYVSGTKLQKSGDLLDMTSNVAPGDSYTIAVDMVSPADAGTYTAVWAVMMGKDTLCTLNLSVTVVK
jgi:hypothetical protein